MARGQFDGEAFHAALDAQRLGRGMTWKKVAEESGVSASTLTRMAQGRHPDVDSMASLLAWSGLDADSFVRRSGKDEPTVEPLAQISAYLRADPNLSSEAASAIEAVVRAAYTQLKKGVP